MVEMLCLFNQASIIPNTYAETPYMPSHCFAFKTKDFYVCRGSKYSLITDNKCM